MMWSAANNSFFYKADMDLYADAGWDLSDCIDVDSSIFEEFKIQPSGKVRVTGTDGMPCWVDIPPLSKGELIEQADAQKSSLISEASKEIAILADAVEFDMATPEEVLRYNALRKYRVELNRVDTSTAPDVTWPQKP